MKPYYQDESVTLYCADFREVLAHIPGCAAVITDPPYGETALVWDRWLSSWPSLMKDIAPQLWCFGSMRMFFENVADFEDWKFAQDVVWEKQSGTGFQSDRFRRVHENVLHFYRGSWKQLGCVVPREKVSNEPEKLISKGLRNAAHMNEVKERPLYRYDGTRQARSVQRVNNCNRYAIHPTQKPLGILRPLIEFSVPKGGLFFDPFCGGASTLAAAKETGRRAIGVEVSEEYCERAAKRLAAMLI